MEELELFLLVVVDVEKVDEGWSHVVAQILHHTLNVVKGKVNSRDIIVEASLVG